MPILDGFGATRAIRSIEQDLPVDQKARRSVVINGRIPVFAVSASLRESQREEMMDLGMDGWILKPIEFKSKRTLRARRGNTNY